MMRQALWGPIFLLAAVTPAWASGIENAGTDIAIAMPIIAGGHRACA